VRGLSGLAIAQAATRAGTGPAPVLMIVGSLVLVLEAEDFVFYSQLLTL
jgi:hypothetical protein